MRDDEVNQSWPSGPVPPEPPGAFRNDMHTKKTQPNVVTALMYGAVIALLCYIVIVILSLFYTAWAHAPEDTDPAMADWFRSLKYESGQGWEGSCCSDKDCFVLQATDLKIANDQYWIKDPDGQDWLAVPPGKVLKRYDNPTGKNVACVARHQVLCFVRVSGT